MREGVEREVGEAGAQAVRAVQEVVVAPVVPARVQARQLVRQPAMRVQEPRLLALALAGPAGVLRLRLGMQGVEAVGVVDVGVRILRLRVDGLVGRGEVRGLEVGIGGVGQRRGAGVGRLTYRAQLGQPRGAVAGAVVAVLREEGRNQTDSREKEIGRRPREQRKTHQAPGQAPQASPEPGWCAPEPVRPCRTARKNSLRLPKASWRRETLSPRAVPVGEATAGEGGGR